MNLKIIEEQMETLIKEKSPRKRNDFVSNFKKSNLENFQQIINLLTQNHEKNG